MGFLLPWLRVPATIRPRQEGRINLSLATYDGGERILVNWDTVCYVEPRGAAGEDVHARLHFTVTAGMGAMGVEVVEDIDAIASMLEAEGEAVVELADEDEVDG